MTSKKATSRRVYSLAAAIGLAVGSMGVAAAATNPEQVPPTVSVIQTDTGSASVDQSSAGVAEEASTDEAVDGVDHQFEGEEIGNNGDGFADADDANEAAEATTSG